MTRIGAMMLALAALVLAGSPAATAGETVLPFHATAQVDRGLRVTVLGTSGLGGRVRRERLRRGISGGAAS